jgi:hypothetical protein
VIADKGIGHKVEVILLVSDDDDSLKSVVSGGVSNKGALDLAAVAASLEFFFLFVSFIEILSDDKDSHLVRV